MLRLAAILLGACGVTHPDPAAMREGNGARMSAIPSANEDLDAVLRAAAGDAAQPRPAPPRAPTASYRLGEALFWDGELSGGREEACASCHTKTMAIGMPGPFSIGSGPMLTTRSMVGFGDFDLYQDAFFWDGRVERTPTGLRTPLGERFPPEVTNPAIAAFMVGGLAHEEMLGRVGGGNELAAIAPGDLPAIWAALMRRLLAIPAYLPLFREAFPAVTGDAFTYAHAAEAMRDYTFEALVFDGSPWDRWTAGAHDALSDHAKRGGLLFFGKAGCVDCHGGIAFADGLTHNLAVPQFGPGRNGDTVDRGRITVTGDPADAFAFRTPSLRHVALTAPYMHNGAFVSLEDAVRHHLDPARSLAEYGPEDVPASFHAFFTAGPANVIAMRMMHPEMLAALDPILVDQGPLTLTDTEVDQLLAFLRALTDPEFNRSVYRAPTTSPSGRVGAL